MWPIYVCLHIFRMRNTFRSICLFHQFCIGLKWAKCVSIDVLMWFIWLVFDGKLFAIRTHLYENKFLQHNADSNGYEKRNNICWKSIAPFFSGHRNQSPFRIISNIYNVFESIKLNVRNEIETFELNVIRIPISLCVKHSYVNTSNFTGWRKTDGRIVLSEVSLSEMLKTIK